MTASRDVLKTRLKALQLKRSGLAFAVWGEAGIGKSYLVRELLRETPCRHISVHATVPFVNIVSPLTTLEPRKLPMWTKPLLKKLEQNVYLDTTQSADLLTALLAALAPVILHLEDSHEATPERFDLIGEVAKRVTKSKGVGLLVTSRHEPPEGFTAYHLESLDENASAQLLQGELKAEVPKEASSWIYQKARGNPLFTLEYIRYLTRNGNLWNDGRAWHWRKPDESRIPSLIEALIEKQLSDAKRTNDLELILGARALLPRADKTLWANVASVNLDALQQANEVLIHKGIFQNDTFIHPLYREIAERSLPSKHKQILARRAIDAFSSDPQAAAEFVEMAGLENDVAQVLLVKAAHHAKETGNESEAGRFLAKACNFTQGEERGKLAFEAAQLLQSSDYPESTRLAQVAVNLLPNNTEAIWWLAGLYAEQGMKEEAYQTLELLPREHASGLDWAAHMVGLLSTLEDIPGTIDLWNAYPDLLEVTDPYSLYRLAFALNRAGDSVKALEVAEQVLERNNLFPLRRAQMLSICGAVYYRLQQRERSFKFHSDALDILKGIGHLRGMAATYNNRSHALWDLERFEESWHDTRESLRLTAELGNVKDYAITLVNVGEFHLIFGNYEKAEETLLQAHDLLQLGVPSEFLVDCETYLSQFYSDSGQAHGAILGLKHARAALEISEKVNYPRAIKKGLLSMARAERQNDHPDKALSYIDQACELDRQEGGFRPETICERARILEALRQPDEALQEFQRAYDIAQQEGRLSTIHEVGLELDRLTNNTEQARERIAWLREHNLINAVNKALRYFPEFSEPTQISNVPMLGRLEVLGAMQFSGKNIQGNKRQELLALLLEARIAGRNEVNKLRLFDELYPEASEDRASASLKKTVSQLRSNLGQAVIQTTSQGYALGAVNSDAEEFLKTGDTSLWRGVYLEGLTPREESVWEALYQALKTKVRVLLEADPKEVVRVGRVLLEADPYDQEALTLSLQAMRQSDNHKSLARLYDDAKTQFAEVGEVLPERWQDFL